MDDVTNTQQNRKHCFDELSIRERITPRSATSGDFLHISACASSNFYKLFWLVAKLCSSVFYIKFTQILDLLQQHNKSVDLNKYYDKKTKQLSSEPT